MDRPQLFLAQLADAAAANGDPQRALRLAREAAQAPASDTGLWYEAALVIHIGAMVRLVLFLTFDGQ
ncbi:hypothetical protein AB0F95_06825 [Micromonospora tulbaghiae]|uniref:hypothetical protein n=1 Tax=Micromonospora tulbaghiae TaxID=479978 RepID=UPI0033E438C0